MADDKADFEVELVDDVSRPAKKAGGALNRLKRVVQSFNLKSGTSRVLRGFGGSIEKGFKKIKWGDAFETGVEKLKKGLLIGGAAFGAVVAGAAAATVSMVDFGQRSRQAFSLLAKEGEVPEQLFQRSIALAQNLGLNIKDTTKQIQKFRALQFSQNQAEALIKMGADMQALGASGEEVSRIFAQLGQIKAKNKLQSEELVTLAESGVSTQVVFAALAKQLGKSEEAIKKMVSAGEITGSQALNAIGTAILVKTGTKQFGEAGGLMAESTLSGMAGVMKARLQGVLFNIGDRAAPAITKSAKVLFDELDRFLESDSGQKMFDGIADTVAAIAKAIRDAIPFVKAFLGGFSEGAAAAFKEVAGAFKMVFEMFSGGDGRQGLALMRSLGQTVGVLTVLLGGLVVAFGGVVSALALSANYSLRLMKGIFETFIDTFGAIIAGVTNFWANLKAIWNAEGLSLGEKSVNIGKQIIQGLVDGINALANLPATVLLGIVRKAIKAAKDALGVKSPSKVFMGIGENTVMGFNKGLASLPTQNVIHSTLANDNALAPVRGNLSSGALSAPATGGRAARGGVSVGPVTINLQVAPGMAPEEARAHGEAAAEGFFSKFHEFFDDMALEEAV